MSSTIDRIPEGIGLSRFTQTITDTSNAVDTDKNGMLIKTEMTNTLSDRGQSVSRINEVFENMNSGSHSAARLPLEPIIASSSDTENPDRQQRRLDLTPRTQQKGFDLALFEEPFSIINPITLAVEIKVQISTFRTRAM